MDIEIEDDDFNLNLEKANEKYGVKRKWKHLYTEDGVPIEPFGLR